MDEILNYSFLEPFGQFQPNVIQSTLFQGDSETTFKKFKTLLLQNHFANFNQTSHKASLGKENSSFFNKGPRPFPRGNNSENTYIDEI